MNAAAARDTLREEALAIDHEQFEVLCKMLIERAEQTRDLELTPFRGDGGIDVHAVIDRELFHARLGVQVKQYAPGNTVGSGSIQRFKGALTDQDYHIGTYITTSSFTSGAIESAERDYIRLIDGERLADVMVASEIGVVDRGKYEIDPEFWEVFETPEDEDIIPSLEVPQADDFDTLRLVLEAIDLGKDSKPGIAEYVGTQRDDSFDPRQADYYGMAGWLLGFIHKEKHVEIDGREVRRWGLTRNGEEYLTYLGRGDQDAARTMLYEAIRDVEIIRRVYDRLEEAGPLERQEIATLVEDETEVSGSTAPRRALSIGRWLAELPEITTSGSGSTEQFTLIDGDLSDFK